MDITVYLPDEVGRWAKDNDLGLSRMLRDAVEAEKQRREAVAAAKAGAATHKLSVAEPDGYGGFTHLTARFHGTRIAVQELGAHGSIEVYLGEDEKLYVHDYEGQLYRDVQPDDLREHVGTATYVEAMRAIGEEPVVDIGLPE